MLSFSLCLLLGQEPPYPLNVSELFLQSCFFFVQSLQKVASRQTSSLVMQSTLEPALCSSLAASIFKPRVVGHLNGRTSRHEGLNFDFGKIGFATAVHPYVKMVQQDACFIDCRDLSRHRNFTVYHIKAGAPGA